MGVDKPNYTQMPNLLLDDLMMYMSEAELKVTLAISRQTFGFHREKIALSLSKLQELTGMSRPTVTKGIGEGIERGTIKRDAFAGGFIYELIINGDTPLPSKDSLLVKKVTPTASKDSLLPLVKNVYQSSKESLPELVKNVSTPTPTLKKVLKKVLKKEKESTARARSVDVHPNTKPILEAYVEALGYEPTNYAQEAKAAKTLAKLDYQPADISAAYALKKSEEFWQDKHLSLQTLAKQIPAMQQALLNGHSLKPKAKGINGYREMLAEQGILI